MYLQLSEKYRSPFKYGLGAQATGFVPSLAQQQKEAEKAELFIFIPAHLSPTGQSMHVREDAFDALPPARWSAVMDALEPYQERAMGIFGIKSKAGKERKEARKLNRIQKKAEAKAIKKGIITPEGEYVGVPESKSGQFLKGVGDFVGDIITGGEAAGGEVVTVDTEAERRLGKKWYQKPGVYIAGGGGLLLLVLLLSMSKKKKR